MIYSFKRLSQYGVLFSALLSTRSVAGTEVGRAPQLGGVLPGVSRLCVSLCMARLAGLCVSLPQKVCPPVGRSLIAGHPAAIA